MYIFNIVTAKYSLRVRNICTLCLILFTFIGAPCLNVYIPSPYFAIGNLILAAIILVIFAPKVIEKTYPIGTLEFNSDSINVIMGNNRQTFPLTEIRQATYRPITGVGKYPNDYSKTIIVEFEFFDTTPSVKIHMTTTWVKSSVEHKRKFWGPQRDIIDLLGQHKIKTKRNRTLRETDCISG